MKKKKGALFLGTSETVGEFVDLFAPLDHKWKLYQSKGDAQPIGFRGIARDITDRKRVEKVLHLKGLDCKMDPEIWTYNALLTLRK
jgi:hypothetical protein